MINKRLLIKNLLSYADENSFYDKKEKLSLSDKIGKAKFLKHICALSNSNPNNNSYLIIGVSDKESLIKGVDFFDDSKLQNLINASFINPPKIQYENVPFPHLPRHKVVGLVTIHPNSKITSLSKNIWKYPKNTVFYRRGSTSQPVEKSFELIGDNKQIVNSIEKNSITNIQLILDGVFEFFSRHKKEYNPSYKVFNEQFVLCWAGKKSQINQQEFLSRVDIELISEQIKLFYSALDEVKIEFNNNSFIITEYILLGLKSEQEYYPLEKTVFHFKPNGKYDIISELLFSPPKYEIEELQHFYHKNNRLLQKLKLEKPLSNLEVKDLNNLPITYLICALNGFPEAKEQLLSAKKYLRKREDKTAYIKYKDAIRILRKVKYQ